MARDRLAAMRAQQGPDSVNSDNDSYPTAGNRAPPRRQNPFAQQDDTSYEMSKMSNATNFNVPADDMTAFYDEISAIQDKIKEFNDNVSSIADLHNRSLNNVDDVASQRNAARLADLVAETSATSAELKRRIQTLERQRASGREGQIRKQQTGLVKTKFVEAIQNYQTVEQNNRGKYRQRMERQFKIVKPDATAEEIKAVVNDESGGQIFSQALINSNRYGESRAAYMEVQERHNEIKRIEKTLSELAQLFNDMSVLVDQQDETINNIQTVAASVEKDTEEGNKHLDKARDSAAAARRKRWICFFIFLVILAIVAIVVAVEVVNNNKKKN